MNITARQVCEIILLQLIIYFVDSLPGNTINIGRSVSCYSNNGEWTDSREKKKALAATEVRLCFKTELLLANHGILNINYKVPPNCHVMFLIHWEKRLPHRRIAHSKLFKRVRRTHTRVHSPSDVNLSNVQRKAKEARAVMHVKHICLDIKRSLAIGFTGGKVICAAQTFGAAARGILMMIKQKSNCLRSPSSWWDPQPKHS